MWAGMCSDLWMRRSLRSGGRCLSRSRAWLSRSWMRCCTRRPRLPKNPWMHNLLIRGTTGLWGGGGHRCCRPWSMWQALRSRGQGGQMILRAGSPGGATVVLDHCRALGIWMCLQTCRGRRGAERRHVTQAAALIDPWPGSWGPAWNTRCGNRRNTVVETRAQCWVGTRNIDMLHLHDGWRHVSLVRCGKLDGGWCGANATVPIIADPCDVRI
jgi:hypothetical protein